MLNPLADDLDDVVALTRPLWDALRGERIFVTGGTGFVGRWLLETFIHANERLTLGASAHVLTRNPAAFMKSTPHLAAHPSIALHLGDVRSFTPPSGGFAAIIHAAAEVSLRTDLLATQRALDTITDGTRRVLAMAHATGARVLHTSSGAVYGRQPAELARIPEEYAGAPDTGEPGAAYGEGKRLAELLCTMSLHEHGVHVVHARCFACIGPYLPSDGPFAVGNFIRDRLAGVPIAIRGDGTPHRSYLYAAELATWLWTLLFRGQAGRAYNVGSEAAVSIAELASLVARAGGGAPSLVTLGSVAESGAQAERYVPSTARAFAELGLVSRVTLPDALERTIRWYRSTSRP